MPASSLTVESFNLDVLHSRSIRVIVLTLMIEMIVKIFCFIVCCNHRRAVLLFVESITSSGGFRSVPCDSWESYEKGNRIPTEQINLLCWNSKE
jgi:Lipase